MPEDVRPPMGNRYSVSIAEAATHLLVGQQDSEPNVSGNVLAEMATIVFGAGAAWPDDEEIAQTAVESLRESKAEIGKLTSIIRSQKGSLAVLMADTEDVEAEEAATVKAAVEATGEGLATYKRLVKDIVLASLSSDGVPPVLKEAVRKAAAFELGGE